MPYTPTLLARAAGTTGGATVYTVPASGVLRTIVKEVLIANTTATATSASVFLGGFAIVQNLTVAANATTILDLSQVLQPGDTVAVSCGVASALNFHISGVVQT